MSSDKPQNKVIASNRRALHDYVVIDRVEAGIVLRGTEVKSIRSAQASLAGSFAKITDNNEAVLYANVPPYEFGSAINHDPKRPRRLLLHKKQIVKLHAQVKEKGFTLIPLALYSKQGLIKVELGICKGKQQSDKRETLRRRTADREAQRAMAAHRKSS
jgi:SsrA-binding protein